MDGSRRVLPRALHPADSPTAETPTSRSSAGARWPYHVGVAVGLSAGLYAGSLACVSILQFDHDRALIADREPVSEAIRLLGQHNDEMAASLELAGTAFEAASAQYAEIAATTESVHADVLALRSRLRQIGRLAAIDSSGLGAVRAPAGHAVSIPRSAPRAGSAPSTGGNSAPPPSNASTGASGAP